MSPMNGSLYMRGYVHNCVGMLYTYEFHYKHAQKSLGEIATSFDEPDGATAAPFVNLTPDLKLRLQFQPIQDPDRGTLHVHIVAGGKPLTQVAEVQDCTSSYIKITLLPDETRSRKSGLISSTCNPAWNEKFEFPDLTFSELSTQGALQLTVFEYSCDRAVGGVYLGRSTRDKPKDCRPDSEEVRHWKEMLMQPGKWIECCHAIKPLPSRQPIMPVPNIGLEKDAVDKERENSTNWRSDVELLKVEDRGHIRRVNFDSTLILYYEIACPH